MDKNNLDIATAMWRSKLKDCQKERDRYQQGWQKAEAENKKLHKIIEWQRNTYLEAAIKGKRFLYLPDDYDSELANKIGEKE